MPVNLKPPDPKNLLPVAGVSLGVAEAGILEDWVPACAGTLSRG